MKVPMFSFFINVPAVLTVLSCCTICISSGFSSVLQLSDYTVHQFPFVFLFPPYFPDIFIFFSSLLLSIFLYTICLSHYCLRSFYISFSVFILFSIFFLGFPPVCPTQYLCLSLLFLSPFLNNFLFIFLSNFSFVVCLFAFLFLRFIFGLFVFPRISVPISVFRCYTSVTSCLLLLLSFSTFYFTVDLMYSFNSNCSTQKLYQKLLIIVSPIVKTSRPFSPSPSSLHPSLILLTHIQLPPSVPTLLSPLVSVLSLHCPSLATCRAESEVGVAAVRRSGTPRKSFSFTHSTPRRELLGADNNLIKITKMGTVSVPVPYPITPLKGSQTWF